MREKFCCKRGSLTIRGHMFRVAEGVLPAVIISHPFMSNERMAWSYAALLSELGYAVFTFDFNGGGPRTKSDGKPVDMTVFTELADLRAVLDHVKSLPNVDAAHITLMGCSQGGVVSALAAKKYGDELERLILFYPALCIPDDARAGKMMFARFDPKNIPPVLSRFPMKLGGDYAGTVVNMDIFDEISGFEKSVLLVHGTKDKIVALSYADRASKTYPDCTYKIISGGGHVFHRKYDREAKQILQDFMRRT